MVHHQLNVHWCEGQSLWWCGATVGTEEAGSLFVPLRVSAVGGPGTCGPAQHDPEQEVGQGGIKWPLGHFL